MNKYPNKSGLNRLQQKNNTKKCTLKTRKLRIVHFYSVVIHLVADKHLSLLDWLQVLPYDWFDDKQQLMAQISQSVSYIYTVIVTELTPNTCKLCISKELAEIYCPNPAVRMLGYSSVACFPSRHPGNTQGPLSS